jgi:co-chaperonin GroES (HSP10)
MKALIKAEENAAAAAAKANAEEAARVKAEQEVVEGVKAKAEEEARSSTQDDTLEGFLQRAGMGAVFPLLNEIGVAETSDILDLDDEDWSDAGISKADKKKILLLLEGPEEGEEEEEEEASEERSEVGIYLPEHDDEEASVEARTHDDTLEGFLQRAGMGAVFPLLNGIGVAETSDILDLDDEDWSDAGISKADKKKILLLLEGPEEGEEEEEEVSEVGIYLPEHDDNQASVEAIIQDDTLEGFLHRANMAAILPLLNEIGVAETSDILDLDDEDWSDAGIDEADKEQLLLLLRGREEEEERDEEEGSEVGIYLPEHDDEEASVEARTQDDTLEGFLQRAGMGEIFPLLNEIGVAETSDILDLDDEDWSDAGINEADKEQLLLLLRGPENEEARSRSATRTEDEEDLVQLVV